MLMSDWSSDVCSSDLRLNRRFGDQVHVMLTQRENLSADAAWRKAIKYRRTTRAVRRYFNDADAVVTVSNGLAEDLHDNFGVQRNRLHTIYNPAFRHNFVDAAAQPVEDRKSTRLNSSH